MARTGSNSGRGGPRFEATLWQAADKLRGSLSKTPFETNASAVAVPGDETLRTIARELVSTVRRNTTIDWAEKESVRAKLRLMVRRILRPHGYPPDKQEKATKMVPEQAELHGVLGRQWILSQL